MNLSDPLFLAALAIAGFLIFRRIQANRAASPVVAASVPSGPARHEGHVLYDAFEACKASAIGDTLKTTLGQHGAGLFMGELGQAVTGKAAPSPAASPTPTPATTPAPVPNPLPPPAPPASA